MSRHPASRRRQSPATTTPPSGFQADMARFDKALRAAGAISTDSEGFAWIDAAKIHPDMLRAFRRLAEYGYANGLL